MIYQEPMASLNPAMKVGQQLMEVPILHDKVSKEEAYKRALADGARGAAARSGAHDALLSAPALRRPAAAHRHRHGAAVEAGAAAARRADHGARRDRRGRHRRTGQGARQGVRHVDDLRVAQSRADPRDLRPHHGDVFGRGGRDRHDQGRLRPDAPSLYAGAVPLDPAARRRQERAAAGLHPRPAAAAARAAEGLQFRPALPRISSKGCCDARRNPDDPGRRPRRPFQPLRPLQRDRLGRAAGRRQARSRSRSSPARRCCKIEDLKKYYKVAANEIFGGGEGRVVKANETISFEARESETVAIVGESGCGKSTWPRCCSGWRRRRSGTVTLGNTEIQSTGIEMRDVETVSSIQMVFQNPFDTLNPSHSVGSQIIRTLEKFGVGKTVADRAQARCSSCSTW